MDLVELELNLYQNNIRTSITESRKWFPYSINMHPEFLSMALFSIVAAYTPGPNNVVASYSGFNFGITKTIPHILGVTLGFTSLVIFLIFFFAFHVSTKLKFLLLKHQLDVPKQLLLH